MLLKHFTEAELTPTAWIEGAAGAAIHVFNPAILQVPDGMVGAGLIMAYRVVLPDGARHIALCRLAKDWSVVAGSVVVASEMLSYADAATADPDLRRRPADPRLVVLGGRLFMHFNSGTPRPNQIYLVEIDPATLCPIAPARPVIRTGGRRPIEKNWMFFESGGDVYVIYALAPLTILRADLSNPDHVLCTDGFVHHWDAWPYEASYGELRGGATPMMHDGRLLIVAHSSFRGPPDPQLPGFEALCYVGAIVVLAEHPPFGPLMYSPRPVMELLPTEQMRPHLPRLDDRVQEALYPDGVAADEAGLIVSYGVNERYAALRRVTWATLNDSLVPAVRYRREPFRPLAAENGDEHSPTDADNASLRGFWWLPGLLGPRSPRRATAIAGGEFVHGNFGDMLVPHLLRRLIGMKLINETVGPKLMSLGSLIQIAGEGDMI